MKNFEKYEKEMKEASMVADTNYNHEIEFFRALKYTLPNFENKSATELVDWLYEDYKESLLTDWERNYLKAVIEPFRNNIEYIEKLSEIISPFPNSLIVKEVLSLKIVLNDERYILIPSYGIAFGKMNSLKHYSLEELGL